MSYATTTEARRNREIKDLLSAAASIAPDGITAKLSIYQNANTSLQELIKDLATVKT